MTRTARPEEEQALLESPEERIAREEAERVAREQFQFNADFMNRLMYQDIFRAWLMWVLNGLQTFDNPFGASPNGFPDHEQTQFLMGKKAAGWFLYTYFDSIATDKMALARREAAGKA